MTLTFAIVAAWIVAVLVVFGPMAWGALCDWRLDRKLRRIADERADKAGA